MRENPKKKRKNRKEDYVNFFVTQEIKVKKKKNGFQKLAAKFMEKFIKFIEKVLKKFPKKWQENFIKNCVI